MENVQSGIKNQGDVMHNLIRKLFGKKEPASVPIAFDAIPSWLQEREKTYRAKLLTDTLEPVHNIRNNTANLQHIVNKIAGAEHDPAIHPKLKSIAKNSLPLFVKAMNASLAKELPQDLDDFYLAAVECVKNYLNNTRGQGRYLQIVFPEEMKAIRNGIDAIGREMNEITASLTVYRKEKSLIDSAKALHMALVDIKVDAAKAAEKDHRITSRIVEIAERIDTIERELVDLSADERMNEINQQKSALQKTENDRDAITRAYAGLSMTASHVFRKAEKIAVKQKHPTEIASLRHAMELLSDHAIPDERDLSASLAVAFPIAERMIASGEILLKNREERAVFSEDKTFYADICATCSDLARTDEACKIAMDELQSHPLLVRINSLNREKIQLEIMLGKEITGRSELEEWRQKTKERVPALSQELREKIKEMVGDGVQLQMDDQMLA